MALNLEKERAHIAPYAREHWNTHGPGDARPTALKIIRDQCLDEKLGGRVVLITGGTSGIGLQTVRALHVTGADVYFTGQDAQKGAEVERMLRQDGSPGRVKFIQMALDSLRSVNKAAVEFLQLSSNQLHILICNAGIRGYPKGITEDGFELHFGINHLGHFALFHAVKHALLSAITPGFQSRVVCLTASGHRQSGIRFHDINFDADDEYEPLLGYAQSKTANIYMALEIERLYGPSGLHGFAVHPGGILGTGLNRRTPESQISAIIEDPVVARRMKSAEQGAATTAWAAVSQELNEHGGLFLEDCQRSEPWAGDMTPLAPGYAPHILDREKAVRLWDMSLDMIGRSSAEEV
ncbi:short-chain dehydrogenase, putative [Paecilomyces variotii No. 5]|uniref:Short-chain dehydrogenase, putative n=1 Tax=Byssochlamys spectabilis (strain No. 5 / NBRC 109023) TaxID=1356009 RepID=V5G6D5_BYSSN|nr:short-chain dehydrogenase, putative [Paecilomyces variotii No. 5]